MTYPRTRGMCQGLALIALVMGCGDGRLDLTIESTSLRKDLRTRFVGLGEILWDAYADTMRLGGAPANFVHHAAALGDEGMIASRVGADSLGERALDQLAAARLSTEFIQIDPTLPTGVARVQLDPSGEPTFTISQQVAWDRLEWTPEWRTVAASAAVVCFGSLALRSASSRETVLRFLHETGTDATRVFDVNLRHSFYSAGLFATLLELSDIAKLNERELVHLMSTLGLSDHDPVGCARQLLDRYQLDLVCITRGSGGSILVNGTTAVEHDGFGVDMVDATGAGDAFAAAVAHHYTRGASLAKMAEAANRLAAWVTTQTGATPLHDAAITAAMKDLENP